MCQQKKWRNCSSVTVSVLTPSKMLMQDLPRKGPFFLHSCKILHDLARPYEILQDFAGILQESCTRFLHLPMQEKRTFS